MGCCAPYLLAACLLVAGGCTAVRQRLGASLVSFETEAALGEKLAARIDAREPMLRNRRVQAYVRYVAAQIAAPSKLDRPEVNYRVKVIDNLKQVNAFSLPAGYIYVYSGLLRVAGNEAELAGVMAHEIGHVVGRHSVNRIATHLGLKTLLSLAQGRNNQALLSTAADMGSAGALARFSRDDERQADQFGFKYLIAAGYDPRGLLSFFEKLKKRGGKERPGLKRLLSSHPATGERIRRLEKMVRKAGNPEGATYAERYLRATASLRR